MNEIKEIKTIKQYDAQRNELNDAIWKLLQNSNGLQFLQNSQNSQNSQFLQNSQNLQNLQNSQFLQNLQFLRFLQNYLQNDLQNGLQNLQNDLRNKSIPQNEIGKVNQFIGAIKVSLQDLQICIKLAEPFKGVDLNKLAHEENGNAQQFHQRKTFNQDNFLNKNFEDDDNAKTTQFRVRNHAMQQQGFNSFDDEDESQTLQFRGHNNLKNGNNDQTTLQPNNQFPQSQYDLNNLYNPYNSNNFNHNNFNQGKIETTQQYYDQFAELANAIDGLQGDPRFPQNDSRVVRLLRDLQDHLQNDPENLRGYLQNNLSIYLQDNLSIYLQELPLALHGELINLIKLVESFEGVDLNKLPHEKNRGAQQFDNPFQHHNNPKNINQGKIETIEQYHTQCGILANAIGDLPKNPRLSQNAQTYLHNLQNGLQGYLQNGLQDYLQQDLQGYLQNSLQKDLENLQGAMTPDLQDKLNNLISLAEPFTRVNLQQLMENEKIMKMQKFYENSQNFNNTNFAKQQGFNSFGNDVFSEDSAETQQFRWGDNLKNVNNDHHVKQVSVTPGTIVSKISRNTQMTTHFNDSLMQQQLFLANKSWITPITPSRIKDPDSIAQVTEFQIDKSNEKTPLKDNVTFEKFRTEEAKNILLDGALSYISRYQEGMEGDEGYFEEVDLGDKVNFSNPSMPVFGSQYPEVEYLCHLASRIELDEVDDMINDIFGDVGNVSATNNNNQKFTAAVQVRTQAKVLMRAVIFARDAELQKQDVDNGNKTSKSITLDPSNEPLKGAIKEFNSAWNDLAIKPTVTLFGGNTFDAKAANKIRLNLSKQFLIQSDYAKTVNALEGIKTPKVANTQKTGLNTVEQKTDSSELFLKNLWLLSKISTSEGKLSVDLENYDKNHVKNHVREFLLGGECGESFNEDVQIISPLPAPAKAMLFELQQQGIDLAAQMKDSIQLQKFLEDRRDEVEKSKTNVTKTTEVQIDRDPSADDLELEFHLWKEGHEWDEIIKEKSEFKQNQARNTQGGNNSLEGDSDVESNTATFPKHNKSAFNFQLNPQNSLLTFQPETQNSLLTFQPETQNSVQSSVEEYKQYKQYKAQKLQTPGVTKEWMDRAELRKAELELELRRGNEYITQNVVNDSNPGLTIVAKERIQGALTATSQKLKEVQNTSNISNTISDNANHKHQISSILVRYNVDTTLSRNHGITREDQYIADLQRALDKMKKTAVPQIEQSYAQSINFQKAAKSASQTQSIRQGNSDVGVVNLGNSDQKCLQDEIMSILNDRQSLLQEVQENLTEYNKLKAEIETAKKLQQKKSSQEKEQQQKLKTKQNERAKLDKRGLLFSLGMGEHSKLAGTHGLYTLYREDADGDRGSASSEGIKFKQVELDRKSNMLLDLLRGNDVNLKEVDTSKIPNKYKKDKRDQRNKIAKQNPNEFFKGATVHGKRGIIGALFPMLSKEGKGRAGKEMEANLTAKSQLQSKRYFDNLRNKEIEAEEQQGLQSTVQNLQQQNSELLQYQLAKSKLNQQQNFVQQNQVPISLGGNNHCSDAITKVAEKAKQSLILRKQKYIDRRIQMINDLTSKNEEDVSEDIEYLIGKLRTDARKSEVQNGNNIPQTWIERMVLALQQVRDLNSRAEPDHSYKNAFFNTNGNGRHEVLTGVNEALYNSLMDANVTGAQGLVQWMKGGSAGDTKTFEERQKFVTALIGRYTEYQATKKYNTSLDADGHKKELAEKVKNLNEAVDNGIGKIEDRVRQQNNLERSIKFLKEQAILDAIVKSVVDNNVKGREPIYLDENFNTTTQNVATYTITAPTKEELKILCGYRLKGTAFKEEDLKLAMKNAHANGELDISVPKLLQQSQQKINPQKIDPITSTFDSRNDIIKLQKHIAGKIKGERQDLLPVSFKDPQQNVQQQPLLLQNQQAQVGTYYIVEEMIYGAENTTEELLKRLDKLNDETGTLNAKHTKAKTMKPRFKEDPAEKCAREAVDKNKKDIEKIKAQLKNRAQELSEIFKQPKLIYKTIAKNIEREWNVIKNTRTKVQYSDFNGIEAKIKDLKAKTDASDAWKTIKSINVMGTNNKVAEIQSFKTYLDAFTETNLENLKIALRPINSAGKQDKVLSNKHQNPLTQEQTKENAVIEKLTPLFGARKSEIQKAHEKREETLEAIGAGEYNKIYFPKVGASNKVETKDLKGIENTKTVPHEIFQQQLIIAMQDIYDSQQGSYYDAVKSAATPKKGTIQNIKNILSTKSTKPECEPITIKDVSKLAKLSEGTSEKAKAAKKAYKHIYEIATLATKNIMDVSDHHTFFAKVTGAEGETIVVQKYLTKHKGEEAKKGISNKKTTFKFDKGDKKTSENDVIYEVSDNKITTINKTLQNKQSTRFMQAYTVAKKAIKEQSKQR